jgi:hypothetical protein
LARGHRDINRRVGLTSVILALGFLVLSVDDFIGIHESVEKVVALVSLAESTTRQREFVAAANGAKRTSGQPAEQVDAMAIASMLLGPLFGLGLASVLTLLMVSSYLPVSQHENLPFLSASITCVFLVGLSEVVYNQAGGSAYWHFRLEVLAEEGSELLALLLFLIFQSRELDALDRADVASSAMLISA